MLPGRLWCVVLCASACSTRASTTKSLEVDGVRAQVPASWSASPEAQTRRLEAAGRRRDPAADVQVVAVGTETSRAPSLALVVIHHSAAYSQGSTARAMARDSVTEANQAAAARGIDAKPSYRCATQHCSLTMSLEYPAASMHVRTHFWRVDGRLVSAGCMGTDLAAVTACEIPPAPPNAESVPPDES